MYEWKLHQGLEAGGERGASGIGSEGGGMMRGDLKGDVVSAGDRRLGDTSVEIGEDGRGGWT